MKIKLSYQPQQLPPPYAYAAVLDINISENQIATDFNLEYLGRESISDDELRAEGFTKSDDLSWSGALDLNWKKDIESLANFKFNNDPDEEIYLHISIDKKELGFPRNIEQAEVLFQELMQAILEQSEIEAPLSLECQIDNTSYQIKWIFSTRSIELNGLESLKWSEGRELLKAIYSIDYESLKPQKKASMNSITFGDGMWFELKNTNALDSLKTHVIGLKT